MRFLISILLFNLSNAFYLDTANANNYSPELTAYAETLIQKGSIHLTGDISCEIGDGQGESIDSYSGSDAKALLKVASQQRIYLYAHGFYRLNPRRTKPPMSFAYDQWSGHLDVVRNQGIPVAACLFVSDTASGFGDHQPTIGDFLFALRALTDDAELYNPERQVVLVGYSTGADYMKQALVTLQNHLEANNSIETVGYKSTRMKVVFLGGVHTGTIFSNLVDPGIQLIKSIERSVDTKKPKNADERFERDWREFERSEIEALASSRGAKQLGIGSLALAQLNDKFRKIISEKLLILNLVGSDDIVAPQSSSTLPFLKSLILNGFTHWDFVSPAPPDKLKLVTDLIYFKN